MIVWGGDNGAQTYVTDGGRFNPTTNTWTTVNPIGAPSGRSDHSAVWTGTEMVVAGGAPSAAGDFGARYQAKGNFWTAFNDSSGLLSRHDHTAVWTGSEMVVWGGVNGTSFLNETWSYAPARTLFLYQRP
jgi:N-acetylneuraminic acid mutarotase